eukprot:s1324_g22.t1
MEPWGTRHVEPGLLNPDWSSVMKGSKVSVVVEDLLWDESMVMAKSFPDGQLIRIMGLTSQHQGCARLTLLDAIVDFSSPYVDLLVSDETCVVTHHVRPLHGIWQFVEMCAGAGISSTGLEKAGFTHACSVELRPKLVELHKRLHPQVPIITGDIVNTSLLKELHALCKPPFSLTAGVARQPFSTGGNQAGQLDDRALTLPALIRACYLMQCPALFVECVTQARSNQWVRAHLDVLSQVLGYHVSEVDLRLEEVWCARRFRWWFTALQTSLGPMHLPPMPTGSGLVVRDLMPFVKSWSHEDMQQLCLTAQEMMVYQQDGSNMAKYVVQMGSKLPTCLHSWGNQITPCECGCREDGLSPQRLLSRGIYSQIVAVSSDLGLSPFRHLHVMEVSLLNGVLPLQDWGSNMRLCLCAVGQLASPLQSAWIGTCFRRHIGKILGHEQLVNPLDVLHAMKTELFAQSKMLFPPLMKQCDLPSVQVQFEQGPVIQVTVAPAATVADLHHAESSLHASPDRVLLLDAQTGEELSADVCIAGRCIRVPVLPESPMSCLDVPMVPATAVDARSDPDAKSESMPEVPETELLQVQALLGEEVRAENDPIHACLKLSQTGLLNMIPPIAPDQARCQALRTLMTSAALRSDLLHQQDQLWGDDEMLWAL